MYKVIVIEDEDWVYEDLKSIIPWEEYGFQLIAHVKRASLAEAIVRKLRPELIITDIMMPEMNGLEIIERFRKFDPDMSIVILSAHSEFEYAKSAMKNNVINYLLKPLDASELIDTLKRVKCKIENGNQSDSVENLNIDSVLAEIYHDILHKYYENLKIYDYAKKYHFNPSYLSRVFKNKYKKSFAELLIEMRIERAKQFVTETDFKIVDIGTMVGYGDYAHFSKIFKEYTGMSPRDFREKSRKDEN